MAALSAAASKNGGQNGLLWRICHSSFANGYLSIADSQDFSLGGPDRCAEDAGKLTIFLDEVLDKGGLDHPITNHKSPITNHQSPITNHKSPITNALGYS
jgi:hypothetical protein